MHIDHQKLVELLIDASGIEAEKVEQQIGELVKEIQQALEDGEAYEIEGFGIFSGLGNRVVFIPSKELETEINFKYVGMEPIELEEGQVQEEKEEESDPFEGLQGEFSEKKRDPFAGLVEDFEEEKHEEDEEEEYHPGPDEWGIEAHKEDNKGANRLLSSLMGEEYEEEPEEEEPSETEEPEATDEVEDAITFDDIFGETGASDSETDQEEEQNAEEPVSGLDAELASLMGDDSEVKSEDELAAGMFEDDDFSDIFGGNEEETAGTEEEVVAPEEIDAEEDEAIDELVEELAGLEEESESEEEHLDSEETEEPQLEEIGEEISEPEEALEEQPVASQEGEFDDFDDPFLDLEADEEDEEESQSAEEDIIPVITNISSDLDPVKKEEPKKKEKPKKEPKPKKPREPNQAPVFLWIIIAMLIIVGATIGLGYFSIINIPGITPQVATNNIPAATPPPQVQQQTPEPVQQEQPTAEIPSQDESQAQQSTPQEQEAQPEVPVLANTTEVPNDQNKYGMMGVASNTANDGYTIVLYSLSVEANAFAKQRELSNDGFRALVTPIASAQYGTLWRVSIGQFATLTDAAIAAEDMPAEFRQSYFIKQISN
ncbi:MAG: SPOR domain-containing protein [Balneola sp.]